MDYLVVHVAFIKCFPTVWANLMVLTVALNTAEFMFVIVGYGFPFLGFPT
jgi:hypothetical protein